MPNAKNVATLAKIKEDLEGASAVWIVDYCGLTVKEIQALRVSTRNSASTSSTLVWFTASKSTNWAEPSSR